MSVNTNHPHPCPSCGGLWRHYEGCVDVPVAEPSFTPGPLTASGNGVHKGVSCVAIAFDPVDGQRVTRVAQANARLFAAAPDLHYALGLLLASHTDRQDECEPVKRARAALALVDGPQKNMDEGV